MGLWVRSYWRADTIDVASPSQTCRFFSALGAVGCEGINGIPLVIVSRSWKSWSLTSDDRRRFFLHSFVAFHVEINSPNAGFELPYWCLVLLSGSIAAIPWIRCRCRFRLRSLFIATTFLAVVQGMIAWLDRAWIGK